jgi:hypothetical protein
VSASKEPELPTRTSSWKRGIPWLITLVCFAYLYTRISGAASREDQELLEYLLAIFRRINWLAWLGLMIPYSAFYFLIDSLVVWRVINWFNARVRYGDILPIRASTYILSIFSEQVGKGAMVLYLNRRDGVPGWQVGSSMLFIMFCEFYYLLSWATIAVAIHWNAFPEMLHTIPWVLSGAGLFFAAWVLYFSGRLAPGLKARDREILQAFREARIWQYGAIVLLRTPALLAAVVVYTLALRLFGVDARFLDMLGYLPVIFFGAAVPGPMRSVAITLWVTLFPDNAGEMAAFGLVQHNFFVFFNAAIGMFFFRRANREIWGDQNAASAKAAS